MHLKKPKKKGSGGKRKQPKGGSAVPSPQDLDDHDEDAGEDEEETQASQGPPTRPEFTFIFDRRLDLPWRLDPLRNLSTRTK